MATWMAIPRLLRWPAAPMGRVRHLGVRILELAVLPPRTGDPDVDARIRELYVRYRSELD